MAPVIEELRRTGDEPLIVTTGQHREMLAQALDIFGLVPDIDLELMQSRQTLAGLTARAIGGLDSVIADVHPGVMLVQGDTTTALCAALAAFYRDVPVGHVEAGLRTNDIRDPFPEEANRRLVSQVATWHFCPTPRAAQNLLDERVPPARVYVTGNPVIDAALSVAATLPPARVREHEKRTVLVTMHRRETQGNAQHEICQAISQLAARDDVHVVFPLHLSPAVREVVEPLLGAHPHVTLCEPLDYRALIGHLATVDLVITDSGGLQEEAPAFNVPVLVMRETTERPEGVEAGCSIVCGTDPLSILGHATTILDDPTAHARMAAAANPYGDGHAARRIVAVLRNNATSGHARRRAVASIGGS